MRKPVDESVLLARAYLSRVGEPGSFPLWSFIDREGPIEAARAIRCADAPDRVLAETTARRETADAVADLDAAERHGARLVVPESDDWPYVAFGALRRVAAPTKPGVCALVPPTALWVRGNGDLARVDARSVAVVGARAATSYGTHVTAEMCFGLASQGVVIVSGGAYGIDAAAHRAALAANGATVIVSAGGVDRPYPPSSASLYDRALENGLVVSESPPGSAPHRSRFLSRKYDLDREHSRCSYDSENEVRVVRTHQHQRSEHAQDRDTASGPSQARRATRLRRGGRVRRRRPHCLQGREQTRL